jgi:hypothetical protein
VAGDLVEDAKITTFSTMFFIPAPRKPAGGCPGGCQLIVDVENNLVIGDATVTPYATPMGLAGALHTAVGRLPGQGGSDGVWISVDVRAPDIAHETLQSATTQPTGYPAPTAAACARRGSAPASSQSARTKVGAASAAAMAASAASRTDAAASARARAMIPSSSAAPGSVSYARAPSGRRSVSARAPRRPCACRTSSASAASRGRGTRTPNRRRIPTHSPPGRVEAGAHRLFCTEAFIPTTESARRARPACRRACDRSVG